MIRQWWKHSVSHSANRWGEVSQQRRYNLLARNCLTQINWHNYRVCNWLLSRAICWQLIRSNWSVHSLAVADKKHEQTTRSNLWESSNFCLVRFVCLPLSLSRALLVSLLFVICLFVACTADKQSPDCWLRIRIRVRVQLKIASALQNICLENTQTGGYPASVQPDSREFQQRQTQWDVYRAPHCSKCHIWVIYNLKKKK